MKARVQSEWPEFRGIIIAIILSLVVFGVVLILFFRI